MSQYKTEWDLKLLYDNINDKSIERDIKQIEKSCINFERKYRNKDFTSSPLKLLLALDDYSKLDELLSNRKSWWYFALKNNLNTSDHISSAFMTKFNQRMINANNRITFFHIEIGKISNLKQKKYLNDKRLSYYKYELFRIFNKAKYNLTDNEEQLIDSLSESGYSMWIEGQKRVLNEQTVEYKGENIPITKAISLLSSLPTDDRRLIHKKINQVTKNISSFAESEINAIYNFKKVIDRKRGFKKPYSETILRYENSEKTIENLVKVVTENFHISRRFYKIHRKLLKEDRITYADRSANIGEIKKKFDFNESISIIRNAFRNIDTEYVDILERFLIDGQIDVYPKKGKTGGAFCWGIGKLPTFVLLNHTDSINSIETFAHEMGHAIHSELSKKQPSIYRNYSTSVAEVASTFFEQILSEELEKYLSKEEKIILIHNKIKEDIMTIFRQIACFNFELDLHNEIRKNGQISKVDMAKLMVKNMKDYMGEDVDFEDDDGYGFVSWMHIRRFFYVYSYAFGQIVSKSLFENWKKDSKYSEKIKDFLSSGSSMSPEEIFKMAGINVSDESFFESGLKSIENDIKKLENLIK